MIEHVFFSHGDDIVAEADLPLGALVASDDLDADIVLPGNLCVGPLCKIELSSDGSVHVSTLNRSLVADSAGTRKHRQRLDHGKHVAIGGFTLTRLRFRDRPIQAVKNARVTAPPTAGSPDVEPPSGPLMSCEVEAGGQFWRVDLDERGLVFGRGTPLDETVPFVDLGNELVSREHAAVFWKDGSFWVSDLGSKHRLTVNGRRVPKGGAMEIKDGDVIRIPPKRGCPTLLFSTREKAIANPRGEPVRSLLLGKSAGIREVQRLVKKLGPLKITVLILGETGTGKELVARGLHAVSFPERPFVAVNCGALTKSLLEGELFGWIKGAFTGAIEDHPGPFEQAIGGTIFLDEIGEIPPEMQVKLLRVIQERVVRRVGGESDIPIHCRIVAGTHRSLAELVARGELREDFYQRLNVGEISVPPLRERLEDIPILAAAWLARKFPDVRLSDRAIEALQKHDWPGNVRELQNVVERSAALVEGQVIEASDLIILSDDQKRAQRKREAEARAALPVRQLGDVRALEKELVQKTLEKCRGNLAKAARELGVADSTLRSRCKAWGI